jgi:hypothetical protein
VRRLTLREVNELHGGVLPPDATLRPDDEPERPAPPAKAKRRSGRGERFAVLNAFVDFTMANLKPSERAVWFVLFRDTKGNGIARTSERDIARRAGCCVRMVRYALAALARHGLVRIVRRGRLQTGPSSYRVFGLAEQPT